MTVWVVVRHIIGYLTGSAIFVVGIPCMLYMVSTRLDRCFAVNLIPWIPIRTGFSLLIGSVGILFVVWSNLYLLLVGGGGPADGFGIEISPRSKHLVTSGPYRYTRNPMVFGALSLYLALALLFNSAICLGLVALLFAVSPIYLRRTEEKRLLKDFGDAYKEYCKTVPMLVPTPRRGGSCRDRV